MKFLMNQFSLVLILSLSMVLFSCGEDKPGDETANDNLSGTWALSSYTIAGQESIGPVFNGVNLTFTSSDAVGGTFSFVSTDLDDEDITAVSSYTVVDDGNRIKIGTDTLDMSVSESNLDLEGSSWFASPGNAIRAIGTK